MLRLLALRPQRRPVAAARFIALALGSLALVGCCKSRGLWNPVPLEPNAHIKVDCIAQSPTTFACTASSTGPDPARACWDVIVTCGIIEHEAEKRCARKLAAGESEVVIVPIGSFEPPITPDNGNCTAPHVDEMKLE
jgi:hypothetical protein